MNRPLLDSTQIHPDALNTIARFHHETVQEVITAVKSHKVVVVGMSQNPVVKKARRHLESVTMDYH